MTSVVLLSSGLDSSVNLLAALKEGEVRLALTFDYGQKAGVKEIEHSSQLCQSLGVDHRVISLPFFSEFTSTALLSKSVEVPVSEQVDIASQQVSETTAKAVWVPNRNGIFLNIAAGFAEGLSASHVIAGFNKEEAMTFPDNSAEYMQQATAALKYSTSTKVQVKSFTIDKSKTEIVRLGRELKLNFDLVWPCYFSGPQRCGQCESCLRFERALKEA